MPGGLGRAGDGDEGVWESAQGSLAIGALGLVHVFWAAFGGCGKCLGDQHMPRMVIKECGKVVRAACSDAGWCRYVPKWCVLAPRLHVCMLPIVQ